MPEMKLLDGKFMMYRGKPLLRENNILCYGDMKTDKYILFMMILSNKTVELSASQKAEVPDRILVQILSTDTTKPAHERMVKQFDKSGLYDAMDIGMIWLNKLNAEKA